LHSVYCTTTVLTHCNAVMLKTPSVPSGYFKSMLRHFELDPEHYCQQIATIKPTTEFKLN